ncbi:MAG: class I SAM-dependent methyltransferase [Acidimicrobiia bacterium]
MEHVIAAAHFAGFDLDDDQLAKLADYGRWLESEAVVAGAIGPGEIARIERRHLADSLLFASQFPHEGDEIIDLGSGVGLPGIPLAIALPDIRVSLIDRSGRRVDLARRAIRVLGLGNCVVVQADVESFTGEAPVIVSRASLPPGRLRSVAERLLAPGGIAVVAGSWQERPEFPGWETREIPRDVLDQPVWLLIMRRQ